MKESFCFGLKYNNPKSKPINRITGRNIVLKLTMGQK